MSVEQEARELLAAECDAGGRDGLARRIRNREADYGYVDKEFALRAITAALLRSSASRDEVLEEAAKACEELAAIFLMPDYATNQPLSSMQERFGCKQCAAAIRALKQPAQGEASDATG